MSVIDYSLSRKGRLRKKLQKLVVGLTLTGLAFSGMSASLFMNTSAAYAAPLAYGHGFNNPGYEYILGSWMTVDGQLAYCIQLQVATPNDTQVFLGERDNVFIGDGSNVSGVQIAQLNYVLNNWGETNNDLQAAAVAWTVWYLTGQVNAQGEYVSFDNGSTQSIFTFAGNGAQANLEFDGAGNVVGGDLYDMFMMMSAEAVANANAGPPAAPADITVSGSVVDGEFVGTANVPAGYTNITLSNATFDSNGSATFNPNRAAGSYAWTASSIPDTATSSFTVSASGTWSTPKTGETVNYWETAVGQDVIGPPPMAVGASSASTGLDIGFSPELETLVPVERVVGDGTGNVTISDTVDFSLNSTTATAPFNSTSLRQFANGDYAQIVANGTLYGPLASAPVQGATIPSGTPVAATTSITTSASAGFADTYDASVVIPDLSGFYTWVWEIDSASQPATTQALIPTDYSFQDDFGIPEETAIVPTKLTFSTELTENRGEAGTVVQDELTTAVDGIWISDADGNIPATLTGTVYYNGTSSPMQQATVPAHAVPVQTLTMDVSEADETYVSDDIVFPNQTGFYTVQWCTDTNYFVESFCDDYGVSSESFEVIVVNPPSVTTQAELTAKFGEDVRDTATVTGDVPGNSSLRFTAYREVIAGDPKFTSNGAVIANEFWTQPEIDGMSEVELCEAQPIGTTGLTAVSGAGEYLSDPISTTAAGSNHRMYWVEELITVDPVTGVESVLAEGECGEPTEITYVSWPTIITDAGGDIQVGDSRGDRTTVGNANEDLTYQVTHDLYFAGENVNADEAPVCDATNLVFSTSEEPVSLTGSSEYEFVSAAYTYDKPGTYYWIEKLIHEGQEVAAGYCGNPSETLTAGDLIDPEPDGGINPPPAATINGTASPVSVGMLLGGLILILGGTATAVAARRIA